MTGYSYDGLKCRKQLYLILLASKTKVMKEVFIGQKILMKLSKVTLNTYQKVYL